MSDDQQTVSIPITDLLGDIKRSVGDLGRDMTARLDRIEGQLAQKADRADVAHLDGRVKALEVEKATREKAREVNAEHQQAGSESRRARMGMWLGAAGVIAAGAEAIANFLPHGH